MFSKEGADLAQHIAADILHEYEWLQNGAGAHPWDL